MSATKSSDFEMSTASHGVALSPKVLPFSSLTTVFSPSPDTLQRWMRRAAFALSPPGWIVR